MAPLRNICLKKYIYKKKPNHSPQVHIVVFILESVRILSKLGKFFLCNKLTSRCLLQSEFFMSLQNVQRKISVSNWLYVRCN